MSKDHLVRRMGAVTCLRIENYGDPFGLAGCDKTDANCTVGTEISARAKSIANSVLDAVGSAGAALIASLPSIVARAMYSGRMDAMAARFATIEQLQHAIVAFMR